VVCCARASAYRLRLATCNARRFPLTHCGESSAGRRVLAGLMCVAHRLAGPSVWLDSTVGLWPLTTVGSLPRPSAALFAAGLSCAASFFAAAQDAALCCQCGLCSAVPSRRRCPQRRCFLRRCPLRRCSLQRRPLQRRPAVLASAAPAFAVLASQGCLFGTACVVLPLVVWCSAASSAIALPAAVPSPAALPSAAASQLRYLLRCCLQHLCSAALYSAVPSQLCYPM
jgi:hypothetical protein